MKNLITKFMDKDIIILLAVVILVAAVIIIINIPKNKAKKNPVRFYKNNFFMLKDKVNNIYVYAYEHKKNDNYNDLYLPKDNVFPYLGRVYINNDNGFIINDVYFSSERIGVNNYYNKDNPILINKHSSEGSKSYGYEPETFAEIKFKTKLDDTSKSAIEYVIEFKPYDSIVDYVGDNIKKTLREPVKIEGTFEIVREDEAEIIRLHNTDILGLYNDKSILFSSERIFSLNVFNFDYLFINGKEKINSSINGVEKFSDEFLKDKINENKDIVESYVKESKNRHWKSLMDDSILNYIDNYADYYNELKEFKSFNILYYDDKTISLYKRVSKIEDLKLSEIDNMFMTFELESQKLISPYLKDLVSDPESLLKKYNAPKDFYSNIDNLIFGVTDSFIIIMKEKGYGKIFIDYKNIKEYINKEHYLAYLFN
ncbi:hypothetical protein A9X77_10460 [Brachyspira hyodysenteriae]|uniref:hypothetical protein n=1 Tax=Brachyspira hyodysenteriae TaxID=159 RepID=UPI00063D8E4C|nr:hypothetical protein [Brachyspira hyodysenteriae]KLI24620.1 hypothetical protein SR30_08310 [Brachyspira hyodysenteriae]TVL75872.1 hypothetical protein A9X77_10460 [Brachyspira hyodysenteriae]TVL87178.1 hypothetical protein A9X78_11315 [Brachyspira hyodysenteriae]